MWDFIWTTLQENSFAQGGIVIGIFSSVLYSLKSIPAALLSFVKRRATSYIKLDHDQVPLHWMLVWLSETEYGKRTKHLTVCDHKGSLTLGSGTHYFWRDRSLVIVSYQREYIEKEGVPVGKKESLSIRVVPGSRRVIENLLEEAKQAYDKRYNDLTKILMPDSFSDRWKIVDRIQTPTFDSVVLPREDRVVIQNALDVFVNNEKKCKLHGIPWRLSFLLHGIPGSGKTSLAKALAGYMRYDIAILSLNGISSDKQLLTLCSDLANDVVLVIEDIDAYNVQRESDKEQNVTLSGLLNALDGLTAKNGRITIMTTNHIEKLDPALIRKGRADVHMEFVAPTEEQLSDLFEKFGYIYQGEQFENMAEAQYYLLNYDNQVNVGVFDV